MIMDFTEGDYVNRLINFLVATLILHVHLHIDIQALVLINVITEIIILHIY